MSSGHEDYRAAAKALLDTDEVQHVLSGAFYTPAPGEAAEPPRAKVLARASTKPAHYKVICISMYTDDLERLDSMVDDLKARGLTKANRSALIRYALSNVNLDNVPRGL